MDDIFLNGFNQLTQGNGTLDHEWPICLGCAAIERSLEKVGMERRSDVGGASRSTVGTEIVWMKMRWGL
jgi:hypothetical protein